MEARPLVAVQVLAVLLLLLVCSSEGYLNSKSQPRLLTLADGFNDIVGKEGGSYNISTLLPDPAAPTTHELGGILGKIGKKMRGKKGSSKKKKEGKTTFSLPLTMFGESPDNVLVTPVYIGLPHDDDNEEDNEPFFVGFDSTATNSWIFDAGSEVHVGTKKQGGGGGGQEGKGDKGLIYPTGRDKETSHSYNLLDSISSKVSDPVKPQFKKATYEGALVTDALKIGPKHIHDFQFLSATKAQPSLANRAAYFDGLLGLTSVKNMIYPGTALFHRMAGKSDARAILEKPAVAFYVSPSGLTGEVTFGGHNKAYLHGKSMKDGGAMEYYPVVSAPKGRFLPDWTLKFSSLSVGGDPKKGGQPIMKNFNAVFMTTVHSAFMTSSKERFKDLATYFKGSQVLTEKDDEMFKDNYKLVVDCDDRAKLPHLELKIKTKQHKSTYFFTGKTVFPRPIIIEKYEGKCASFFGLIDFEEHGLPVSSKDVEWAIGTDFIRSYYIEFSLSKIAGVKGYVGIGVSGKKELEYHGPERKLAPVCPRPEPAPEQLPQEQPEPELPQPEPELPPEQPQQPETEQPQPVPEPPIRPAVTGGSLKGGRLEPDGSVVVEYINRDGRREEVEARPITPKTRWTAKRWAGIACVGALAAASFSQHLMIGSRISETSNEVALYLDETTEGAGGGILRGIVGDDKQISFYEGPSPLESTRTVEVYGDKGCQPFINGRWNSACALDDGMWPYKSFS